MATCPSCNTQPNCCEYQWKEGTKVNYYQLNTNNVLSIVQGSPYSKMWLFSLRGPEEEVKLKEFTWCNVWGWSEKVEARHTGIVSKACIQYTAPLLAKVKRWEEINGRRDWQDTPDNRTFIRGRNKVQKHERCQVHWTVLWRRHLKLTCWLTVF